MGVFLSDVAAVKRAVTADDQIGARLRLGGVSLDVSHGLPKITAVKILSAMRTGHRVHLDHALTWSASSCPPDRAESLYSKVRSRGDTAS
jgi:hypothetical protein